MLGAVILFVIVIECQWFLHEFVEDSGDLVLLGKDFRPCIGIVGTGPEGVEVFDVGIVSDWAFGIVSDAGSVIVDFALPGVRIGVRGFSKRGTFVKHVV